MNSELNFLSQRCRESFYKQLLHFVSPIQLLPLRCGLSQAIGIFGHVPSEYLTRAQGQFITPLAPGSLAWVAGASAINLAELVSSTLGPVQGTPVSTLLPCNGHDTGWNSGDLVILYGPSCKCQNGGFSDLFQRLYASYMRNGWRIYTWLGER